MAEAAVKTVPLDKTRALQWLQTYGVYAGVALLLVVNIAITPHFLSAENFRTQAVQVAPVIIVALGMALVIGTEGVDLSVGAVMALAASVTALYLGYGLVCSLLVVAVFAAVAGLANGALVALVGCSPSWRRSPSWWAGGVWPWCCCRSWRTCATRSSRRSVRATCWASRT